MIAGDGVIEAAGQRLEAKWINGPADAPVILMLHEGRRDLVHVVLGGECHFPPAVVTDLRAQAQQVEFVQSSCDIVITPGGGGGGSTGSAPLVSTTTTGAGSTGRSGSAASSPPSCSGSCGAASAGWAPPCAPTHRAS